MVSSFLLGINWGDSRGDDCVDDKKYSEIDFRGVSEGTRSFSESFFLFL